MYVIVSNHRIVWRGSLRSTCIRLAPFFQGVPCIEAFGEIRRLVIAEDGS